jgi:hypothetical protein
MERHLRSYSSTTEQAVLLNFPYDSWPGYNYPVGTGEAFSGYKEARVCVHARMCVRVCVYLPTHFHVVSRLELAMIETAPSRF